MDEVSKKLMLRLQSQCAKREYCEEDIRQKALKALDFNAEAAAEVVAGLVADKFVDNLRYASAFAREKAAFSGWGPVKIRYALTAKRIPAAVITEALGEIDPGVADEKKKKVLLAKWKTLEGDPQANLKLIRFALSRGYEYDSVKDILSCISDS